MGKGGQGVEGAKVDGRAEGEKNALYAAGRSRSQGRNQGGSRGPNIYPHAGHYPRAPTSANSPPCGACRRPRCGVHLLLLVRLALDEVSAIRRCSTGAGLRQQDAVEWHIVQRARVGDAAVPVGRHLVIVRCGAAALGVTALVGLRRELEMLRCVLGRVTIAHCCAAREVGSGRHAGGGRAVAEGEACLSSHGTGEDVLLTACVG